MNRAEIRFAFPKGVFFPSPVVVCMALIFFFLLSFSTPAITGPNRSYLLQVGSFVSEAKAAQEVKRLEDYGAFTAPATVNAEKWNRVYVGPYRDKTAAKKQGALMKQRGVISGYLTCPQFAGPGAMAPPTAGRGVSDRPAVLSRQGSPAKMRPVKDSLTVAAATVAPPSSPVAAKAAAPAPVVVPASPVKASPASSPAITGAAAGSNDRSIYLAQGSAPQQAAAPPAGLRSGKDIPTESNAPSLLDLHPTIAYNLWYMDMSRKYVNTDYLGKGFVHGPTIGLSFHDLSGTFTFLTSAGAFRGDERRHFSNGQGFLLGEQFDRSDFDLTLKYPVFAFPPFTLSALLGMQWTRLSSMSANYSLDSGQQYTITGSMDIWGPAVGMEIKAPLGNPSTTPVFLFLSGKVMYLRATGNSIYDVPASGGQYGTSFEGASFSSNGWGGNVDAHVTWNIVKGLGLTMGAAIQSAGITDTSPAGNTMRTTNGYYSGYGNLSYTW